MPTAAIAEIDAAEYFDVSVENGRLAWIRHAWQGQQLQPLVCKETVNELLRVLAYPKFKLAVDEQKELLADLLAMRDAFPGLILTADELAQAQHAGMAQAARAKSRTARNPKKTS